MGRKKKIKGTNLGNWLVLEKWMEPAMFSGTEAEDETWLNRSLNKKELARRMKKHRDTYITRKDFRKIAESGLNLVRIPVPYFIFGDRPPYIGCLEYLDKAFVWAGMYRLKILIDLHTTPGCQNGYDNGGIVGVCKWHSDPEGVEFVLTVLERLAQRYGHRRELFGIEVVNEPISYLTYRFAPTTGKAADMEEAKGSSYVPTPFLKTFYKDAYQRLRKYLPEKKAIVFHDGFRLHIWRDYFVQQGMKNVYVDVHPYIWAMEMFQPVHHPLAYEIYLAVERYKLRRMQKYTPVIIGEWSLCNHYALNARTKLERKRRFRKVAGMQQKVWKECAGMIYWSWKLYPDHRYKRRETWKAAWDYEYCLEKGWMPPSKGREKI